MRKKTGFVLAGIFLAVLLAATYMPATAVAGPIKLTYANFPPAPTFPCVQMEKWKEVVEKRTNGKVAIQTFPGGTLLKAKGMMDGVIAGTADIGCICMAYQPGRFRITNAVALPLGLPNSEVASLTLWDLYKKYRPKGFDKVKVLTMFTTAPSNIMSTIPIKSLADLKGVPIRASGGDMLGHADFVNHAQAMLEFRDSSSAALSISWLSGMEEFTVRLYGSGGSLVLDVLYDACVEEHGYLSPFDLFRRYYEGLKATVRDYLLGLNPYDRPMQAYPELITGFVRAIEEGRRPPVSLEEAMTTVLVLDEMRKQLVAEEPGGAA